MLKDSLVVLDLFALLGVRVRPRGADARCAQRVQISSSGAPRGSSRDEVGISGEVDVGRSGDC